MTTCNKCGKDFNITRENVFAIQEGEYSVSYFECPDCKEKYLIGVYDDKARELISQRRQIEQILRISREKHFRPNTVRKYIQEREKVISEQKKLFETLKPIGEEILKSKAEGEGKNVKEHHTDQSG